MKKRRRSKSGRQQLVKKLMSITAIFTLFLTCISYSNREHIYASADLQDTNGSWETESNDSIETATALTSCQKTYGSLYDGDDTDYYKFVVTKTGCVRFFFSVETDDAESVKTGWRMIFYTSKGQEFPNKKIDTKTDAISEYFNFKKGTVLYVSVFNYVRNNPSTPIDVPYSIYPDEKSSSLWEIESNDTKEESTKLTRERVGTIYHGGDADIYRYKARMSGKRRLYFRVSNADPMEIQAGYRIRIYQNDITDSNEIESDYDIRNDETIYFTSEKGSTYYINIESDGFIQAQAPINILYDIIIK